MKQRFSGISVHTYINCSSTGHYTAEVRFNDGIVSKHYTYLVDSGACVNQRGDNWLKLPRYVIAEIKRQLADFQRDNKLVVYECDQEGNRRYRADLRYHRPEWFAQLVGIKDGTP